MSRLAVRSLAPLDINAATNKLGDRESSSQANECNLPSPVIAAARSTFCEARTPPAACASEPSLLADRFLLLEYLDTGAFVTTSIQRRCVDTVTGDEYVCREYVAHSRASAALIEAHHRLSDCPYVTPIAHLIQTVDAKGAAKVYVLLPRCYGDLHAYLRTKKRLRENEARSLFRQAAETVRECHSRGMVLTDLRLRRFVFADVHRTKIRLESLEEVAILDGPYADDSVSRKHGYPAYVTPEVILGRGGLCPGRASDMWSLGIILFTLLVGRYPFQDSGPLALFTKILRGHFTVPDFVSSRAKCLIRSLLRKDPTQRLEASDVLKHPWFSVTLRCDRVEKLDSKEQASRALAVKKSTRNRVEDQVVPHDADCAMEC